jgi:hypothetical protein
MAPPGTLYLGATRRLDGGGSAAPLYLPTHHLVTHGVPVIIDCAAVPGDPLATHVLAASTA